MAIHSVQGIDEGKTEFFDFGSVESEALSMKVDIGSAAYWSELMQVQTMDNLFAKGVITDVVTYLEGIPEQYLKNKSKILSKLKNDMAAMENGVAPAMGAELPSATPAPMPMM